MPEASPSTTRIIRHWLAHPLPWLAAFALWVAATFTASSFAVPDAAPSVEIPHFDKVIHFCWFTIGGVILGAAVLTTPRLRANRMTRLVLPVVLLSLLGALDEFRQSFTPGRTGNDPGDWLSDTLGGAAGVLLVNAARRRITRFPEERF
jgi:VanZ family protein